MKGMRVRPEFKVHMLTEAGKRKAELIAQAFSDLLDDVESIVDAPKDGRESANRDLALVRTKLEEANFVAKRAMASRNCQPDPTP